MTLLSWSPVIFAVLMSVVCLACVTLGDWEERVLGALYGMACFASLAAASRLWREPQWAVGAIDLAYLVAVGLVVWRSRKFWPIWIGAMQILTVASHVAYLLAQRRFGADAYLTVLGVWSYGVVVCLAVAVVHAGLVRRRRLRERHIETQAQRLLAERSDPQEALEAALAAAERHAAERPAHEV